MEVEEVLSWLSGSSLQEILVVSSRAALRYPGNPRTDPERWPRTTLLLLRNLLVSTVAAAHSSADLQGAAAEAAKRSEPWLSMYLDRNRDTGRRSSAMSAGLKVSHAATMTVAQIERSVVETHAVRVIYYSTGVEDPQSDRASSRDMAHVQLDHMNALERPLWEGSEPEGFVQQNIEDLDNFFDQDPATWSFWKRWYHSFLDGRSHDWELYREVALIPNEDWDQGAQHVARIISQIEARRLRDAENIEEDQLLSVQLQDGRLETFAEASLGAEFDERLKRALHDRLRTKAGELAQAAGNRFPRLAGLARAVVLQTNRPFEQVDLFLLHLEVEDLASRRDYGVEDDEVFPPEVLGPLDDVLRFSPGLTLGDPSVDLLVERVSRFRATPLNVDDKIAHTEMSRVVADANESMGDRLRAIEERVEALPVAVATAIQTSTHRNILWTIAVTALGITGHVALEAVAGSLSPSLTAFVVANWPIVVQVGTTYGLPFLNWFLVSVASQPELSVLVSEVSRRLRAK